MALWVCDGCTAAYAPEAPRCPHCGSDEYHEQGDEMPKISAAGGPSGDDPALRPSDYVPPQVTDTEGEAVEGERTEQGDPETYDPADYTVAEVNDYLDQCAADGNDPEADRVLTLERAGKARSGILNRG